jgi:hypothetical protein
MRMEGGRAHAWLGLEDEPVLLAAASERFLVLRMSDRTTKVQPITHSACAHPNFQPRTDPA